MDDKYWKPLKMKEASSSSFGRSLSTSSTKSPLLRSSSVKVPSPNNKSSSSSSSSSLARSYSQKGGSISRKCSSLAKEHKARFYIMRRCVAMLVCWHKHGDP